MVEGFVGKTVFNWKPCPSQRGEAFWKKTMPSWTLAEQPSTNRHGVCNSLFPVAERLHLPGGDWKTRSSTFLTPQKGNGTATCTPSNLLLHGFDDTLALVIGKKMAPGHLRHVVSLPVIQSQASRLARIPAASKRPATTVTVSPLLTFSRPAGDELGEALSETLTLQEQLRKLQEELYHLRWSVKDVAERALQEALKQAKLPGFTGWAVQEIINHFLEKLEENRVPMPDYALKSSGAAVIHSRTSPSFKNTKGKVLLFSLPVLDYVRSPELILEPENHPGNCWPFPGSQGHVFIKLSVPIIPRAVTMDHVSGTTFHGDSTSSAPKDFAVYGLKEEHEEQGTFLGQFTFQALLNPSQTFQLKNELSGFVNYIRLQVLSNWGHPDYTCLYRFRVHGDPPKDGGKVSVSSGNKFH
ncbi:SUN domain-containing protein 3-like [Mycteria americana]|uniref:SUN domain-containing protein 3-like n=1 Tax=Mycteria americana TaxID=33587 RepID=UPI003F58FAFC